MVNKFTSDDKKVRESLKQVYKNLKNKCYSVKESNDFIKRRMSIKTLKLKGLVRNSKEAKNNC